MKRFEYFEPTSLPEAFALLARYQGRAQPLAGGTDPLPPLIADGAEITIHGPGGHRTVLLEEFFTGPGKTVLGHDELVTTIRVPAPPPRTGKVYIKHGRRKAMELATVGVAVTLN